MLTLTANQKVALAISPVDAKGNAAPVDSAPTWRSSDEALLSLDVAEDGLSATAVAVGPLGTVQIRVDADADLGDGTVSISGVLDVEIIAGQAVALGITAGAPTEQ